MPIILEANNLNLSERLRFLSNQDSRKDFPIRGIPSFQKLRDLLFDEIDLLGIPRGVISESFDVKPMRDRHHLAITFQKPLLIHGGRLPNEHTVKDPFELATFQVNLFDTSTTTVEYKVISSKTNVERVVCGLKFRSAQEVLKVFRELVEVSGFLVEKWDRAHIKDALQLPKGVSVPNWLSVRLLSDLDKPAVVVGDDDLSISIVRELASHNQISLVSTGKPFEFDVVLNN